MWEVQDPLIVGVTMNSRHHTTLDTKIVVDDLHDRRQTVCGARPVGHDGMFAGIECLVIHTHHDCVVDTTFARGTDNDAFGARIKVCARLIPITENTGALQYDVHFQLLPRQVTRIPFCGCMNGSAIDKKLVVYNFYGPIKFSVD